MIKQFGVRPRAHMISGNSSHCSVASHQDLIYVNTTNARGYTNVPAPDAPSLICLQKDNGQVRWFDKSPGKDILDVQNGSPLVIEIGGQPQVIMGQGDGWMRGFHALTGEVLWKFDINPKKLMRNRAGFRSQMMACDLIAMPVFYDNRVYFAAGRDYESGTGPGRVCCIDPTKRGDISSELDDGPGKGRPNLNSGLIWEYLGKKEPSDAPMHSSVSAVAIHKGLLIAPDTDCTIHCLDAATGQAVWTHETLGNIMTSPLIVGDRVYVAAERFVSVFELSREKKLLAEIEMNSSVEASPAFANGTLFMMNRDTLFAIKK